MTTFNDCCISHSRFLSLFAVCLGLGRESNLGSFDFLLYLTKMLCRRMLQSLFLVPNRKCLPLSFNISVSNSFNIYFSFNNRYILYLPPNSLFFSSLRTPPGLAQLCKERFSQKIGATTTTTTTTAASFVEAEGNKNKCLHCCLNFNRLFWCQDIEMQINKKDWDIFLF